MKRCLLPLVCLSLGAGCDPIPPYDVCGDGWVGAGEACDDGNGLPGDGCAPDCTGEGVVAFAYTLSHAGANLFCEEGGIFVVRLLLGIDIDVDGALSDNEVTGRREVLCNTPGGEGAGAFAAFFPALPADLFAIEVDSLNDVPAPWRPSEDAPNQRRHSFPISVALEAGRLVFLPFVDVIF